MSVKVFTSVCHFFHPVRPGLKFKAAAGTLLLWQFLWQVSVSDTRVMGETVNSSQSVHQSLIHFEVNAGCLPLEDVSTHTM